MTSAQTNGATGAWPNESTGERGKFFWGAPISHGADAHCPQMRRLKKNPTILTANRTHRVFVDEGIGNDIMAKRASKQTTKSKKTEDQVDDDDTEDTVEDEGTEDAPEETDVARQAPHPVAANAGVSVSVVEALNTVDSVRAALFQQGDRDRSDSLKIAHAVLARAVGVDID